MLCKFYYKSKVELLGYVIIYFLPCLVMMLACDGSLNIFLMCEVWAFEECCCDVAVVIQPCYLYIVGE